MSARAFANFGLFLSDSDKLTVRRLAAAGRGADSIAASLRRSGRSIAVADVRAELAAIAKATGDA